MLKEMYGIQLMVQPGLELQLPLHGLPERVLALKFLITKCGFLVALRIMMFGILLTDLLGQKPTITLIGVHEVMLGRLYLVINFGLCVAMTELKTFQMYGTGKYSQMG